VALYLTAPFGDALVREAEYDGARASDRVRISAPRGLTGTVLENGRLVATGEPALDPRFDPEVDTAEDGVARPLLCGPLRFRNKILGVFRAFPAREADAVPELGEVLSAALSAAVRNALLYRSLVETIEEVAAARRQAETAPSDSQSEGF
jgi:GAF domain-containing protein